MTTLHLSSNHSHPTAAMQPRDYGIKNCHTPPLLQEKVTANTHTSLANSKAAFPSAVSTPIRSLLSLLGTTLKQHKLTLALIVLLALLIEVVIANSSALFFSRDDYPQHVISLPAQGIPITPKSQSLTLSDLDLPLATVYLQVKSSSRQLVSGQLLMTDDARTDESFLVGTFEIGGGAANTAPSGEIERDVNAILLKPLTHGHVRSLTLAFNTRGISPDLHLTKLILNYAPPFRFSVVRVLLSIALLAIAYSVTCTAVRQQRIRVNSRVYKLLNRSVFAIALLGAVGIFTVYHPQNATDSAFYLNGLGVIPYNTPDQSLLIDLPETPEEIIATDAYTQLLQAFFVKHQLYIDFTPDARLAYLDNPYDPTQRMSHKVDGLWDRAYYQGKQYVYFGLAPLVLIYAPIYLLTGQAPCAALAAFIASLMALGGLYLLSNRLLALFTSEVNPLFFVLGKLALFLGTQILAVQVSFTHYALPYLTAFAFLCVALSCLMTLARFIPTPYPEQEPAAAALQRLSLRGLDKLMAQRWWWHVELVLAGVAVVLVVASRPLQLSIVLLFAVPLYVLYLLSADTWRNKLLNTLCLALPVVLGAIGLAWYNYARFDSITEFGQFNQLTVFDTHYNKVTLLLGQWQNALYHLLVKPFDLSGHFPFVKWGTTMDTGLGNYFFQSPHSGFINFPLLWGLALLAVWWKVSSIRQRLLRDADSDAISNATQTLRHSGYSRAGEATLLQATTYFMLFGMVWLPFLIVIFVTNANFGLRYVCEFVMWLSVIAFVLWQSIPVADKHLSTSSPSAEAEDADAVADPTATINYKALFFVVGIGVFLLTIVLSFFLTVGADETIHTVNPEFYLHMRWIFDPLRLT